VGNERRDVEGEQASGAERPERDCDRLPAWQVNRNVQPAVPIGKLFVRSPKSGYLRRGELGCNPATDADRSEFELSSTPHLAGDFVQYEPAAEAA
jgi:hypothetical protein